MHGVCFFQMKQPKSVCGALKFDELNGVLLIRGFLRKVGIFSYDNKDFQQWLGTLPATPTLAGVLEDKLHASLKCAISINNSFTGRAMLDEDTLPGDEGIFALQLMTEKAAGHASDGVKFHHQWVLLLRKVKGLTEVYERIGAGLIVSTNPKFTAGTPTNVYIR
jgi:hypothetical protein